jgi:hypothetical protein
MAWSLAATVLNGTHKNVLFLPNCRNQDESLIASQRSGDIEVAASS